MSSANKTPGMGLNQWALSDPFVMGDFNADNAKIDAAITAQPWVRLLDVTTTQAATSVELNLTSLNPTKYSMLRVCFYDPSQEYQYVRLNKIATNNYVYIDGSWQTAGNNCRIFGSWMDISLGTKMISWGNYDRIYTINAPTINASQLKTVDVVGAAETINIPVGTRYVVWGVKK